MQVNMEKLMYISYNHSNKQTLIGLSFHSDSDALNELRRESQDMYNRLHSIAEDVAFVNGVHKHYTRIPLIPNLRCGAWYTDPQICSNGAAYFKSTDGHFGNWSFNLRRPNLHLLPTIVDGKGLILVDSTRAGKRIPDALSKTVPIWCSVINQALLMRFPDLKQANWDTGLYTPPGAVSTQEHSQIEARLNQWAKMLSTSSYDLPRLPCPLRPLWVTPINTILPHLRDDILPVICVSASKLVKSGLERRSNGYIYIQGSADDHELWAEGLTPSIFWKHYQEILQCSRSKLEELTASLIKRKALEMIPTGNKQFIPIIKLGQGRILLGSLSAYTSILRLRSTNDADRAYIVVVSSDDNLADRHPIDSNTPKKCPALSITSPSGKKGQMHFLQHVLPTTIEFGARSLENDLNICICCPTGTDVSVGIALTLAQMYFTDDGLYNKAWGIQPSKESIRKRLHWIIASYPEANPSRTTLKRVNEYLLSPSNLRRQNIKGDEEMKSSSLPKSHEV